MFFTTTVRVFLVEGSVPLRGVQVELYDRDRRTADDLLGAGRTDARGEVVFRYQSSAFGIDEILDGIDVRNLQREVYATVLNAHGKVVRQSRVAVSLKGAAQKVSVPLDLALARREGLVGVKKGRTVEQKQADWLAAWRKRTGTGSPPGPEIDLCLARLALEAVAGLGKPPSSAVERRVARYVKSHLSSRAQDVERATRFAERGVRLIDDSGLSRCSGDAGVKAVAKRMFAPGGPGHALAQALSNTAPDPEANLGSPAPGTAFTTDLEFVKVCKALFEEGSLTEPALTQMTELVQGTSRQLLAPSVNLIEVWDPVLQNNVRVGSVPDRTLTVQALAAPDGGWASAVVDLDVPLDDPSCLVALADADGNQSFVIDALPGQKLRLLGSGFVADRATLEVTFRAWEGDDDGRLTFAPPEARQPVPGLDGVAVNVHGNAFDPTSTDTAQNYLGDTMVLVWPDAARTEGLYTLIFEFENTTEHLTELIQQPEPDCTVSTSQGPVRSAPLHVLVLPRLTPRQGRVSAATVTCVDETDPEDAFVVNLADDVLLTVQGFLNQVQVDDSGTVNVEEQGPEIKQDDSHLFFSDGETWQSDLQAWPDDGFEQLRLNELLHVIVTAEEVDGEADRALVQTVLTVLMVLIVIALIAIMIAVIVILVATEVITAGLATALVLPLAQVIAGFLVGAAFTAGQAAIETVMAAVTGLETIGRFFAGYSGQELASRLSRYRYHRVLFLGERPALAENGSNTERISSEVTDAGIIEVFRSSALGGEYRFTLVCSVN